MSGCSQRLHVTGGEVEDADVCMRACSKVNCVSALLVVEVPRRATRYNFIVRITALCG